MGVTEVAKVKKDRDKTTKMRSREREDFARKLKIVQGLKDKDSESKLDSVLEEGLLSKMENIGTLEPEDQWNLVDALDAAMEANGLDEATQARILTGTAQSGALSGDSSTASSSVTGHKRPNDDTKTEEEKKRAADAELMSKMAAEAAAQAELHQRTMQMHMERMQSDPLYRQQMETILATHHQQQLLSGKATLPSSSGAIGGADAQQDKQLPPPVTDADYASSTDVETDDKRDTIEDVSLRSLRNRALAETALDMASQALNSTWIQIHCYLPRLWEPAWLSSELLHWKSQGLLSRECGVAGMVARKTPATLFAEDDNMAYTVQNQISWLSGGHIRCGIVRPSEISQQENQFKDVLNAIRDQLKAMQMNVELSFLRPKRRPKKPSVEPDDEGWKNDWWSIGFWSNSAAHKSDTKPLVLFRCEYYHDRNVMQYFAGIEGLKEIRMTRAQMDKVVRQMHTYYRYSLDYKQYIHHVRNVTLTKAETDETAGGHSKGMAQPVDSDYTSLLDSSPSDAWQAYLSAKAGKGKGKGKKGGKSKGKSKKGDDSKGDSGKSKGKGKGKSPYGKNGNAWSSGSHGWSSSWY